MSRDLCLLLDEDFAALIDEEGEEIWTSDEDDNFDYDNDTEEQELIEYLVKSDFVASEDDINEVTDERADGVTGEFETLEEDDPKLAEVANDD